MSTQKSYIRGHFVGIGLASGIPIGVPIGFMIGRIELGLLVGLMIGLVAGLIAENRLNKTPIPMSNFEKKRQRVRLRAAIIGGVLLIATLSYLYFTEALF